jgi:serine/threonine-protein kinase
MSDPVEAAEAVFLAALDRPTAERAGYMENACTGHPELHQRVRELLEAHEDSHGPLDAMPDVSAAINGMADRAASVGAIIGPYKLMEQIGEGGMGLVFVAEQMQPVRRKVALKVIKPGMDTRQVVARFEAERQALALMDHPNIAKVFDGGATASGRPYFVMELVKGVPITQYCDNNRLSPRERLELFTDVCQAVQHAHQKGIIHRDLKPSNIMVMSQDGTPVVKVIDFGVAKAIGQQLTEKTIYTQFTQLIGSPLYMSPEQAGESGMDIDTRTDIYALGVLLYELLTGTTPFGEDRLSKASFEELRRIIREEEPAKPSTRISTLGQAATTISIQRKAQPKELSRLFRGELDWIVMKALEKDRSRRYETASAMAADVRRYLNDEPVLACPPSATYRLRKFARRHTAGLGIAGLALVFVVLLGSGAGWTLRDRMVRQARLSVEVEHALDDASKAREQASTFTDSPIRWEATLAEAASHLKRAKGLAEHDETALEPTTLERLQALHAELDADETDRRFAGRFEEILLAEYEVNVAKPESKIQISYMALKRAFHDYYRIEFGTTTTEQVAAIIQERSKAIQDLLLASLDVSLEYVPKADHQSQQWLAALLDAADPRPWRKRAQQALRASDWKAFEQVFEEAVTARQSPLLLDRLAAKTPWGSPIHLKLLRRFRQAYPGDFWANHSLAGYLHYANSQPEEAIRYYTAALALRPHNPIACANLGHALRSLGDLDGAISAYREAIDGHADYVAIHESLALALDQKGDADGAAAELRETIRLRNYVQDHIILGNILLRKGSHDEAIARYRKAIELDPKLATTHYNLGIALAEKGSLPEAVASFRAAIARYRLALSQNPRDGFACNNLAWILVTCPLTPLRDPAESLKLARRAVDLAPGSAAYLNTLGLAYYRARNWDEAMAALTKAVQLGNGGNGYDFFFLAMAHWQRGEKEKARQCYDRGVQWQGKFEPRTKELGRFRAEAAELLGVKEQPK